MMHVRAYLTTSLAALAATAMASTACAEGDTAAYDAGGQSSVVSPTAPRTTLTLHVATCRRCPVALTSARPGRPVWQSATKRVHNGAVTFTVPTRRTHGMTVSVTPRWQTLNAVPLVVFRYANTEVGQRVTNAVARIKRRGSPCWAGTNSPSATLNLRVVKYAHRSISGQPGNAIRVWSQPTRSATPPYLRTFKGTVATQAVVVCGS